VIIADTSGLLALFNVREPRHVDARRVMEGHDDPLVISPFVIAELDYLVATRMGVDAELEVLNELGGGAYHLGQLDAEDLRECAKVVDRYRDQEIGVTDASVVVLASRHRTRSVLTLDHRHFNALRPIEGGRFRLLP
jgi:predicted nucleic acid-binding protein